MLMNDDNEKKQQAKSPLKNDDCGRFSRKGKVVNKLLPYYPLFDDILTVVFSFSLIAVDFMLFAGSGNIRIFNNSIFPIPEVLLILGIFLLIISAIIALTHKYKEVKAGISAFITFMFVLAIYKQFSQLTKSVGVGNDSVSVSILIGGLFATLVFWIYAQPKILYKIFLTVASLVLFFNVSATLNKKEVNEFITTVNENFEFSGKDERLIYFILPNFLNPSHIKPWNNDKALETSLLAEAFYKENNFLVFNNAYVEATDYFNNMIMLLNPKAKINTINKYVLNTRLLSGYWRFSNLIYNNINLKENELYDYLSYQGYQISAYKSRHIDLCRKNHQLNVQRCVEKVNKPTNISDMNLSLSTRAKILFIEWFFSLNLGNMRTIADNLKLDKPQQLSIIYNSLYVMNSLKFFDILFENIKEDKGKQAYFVFADIPSDMYIYDEFCQIKPKEKWMDRANLPWVNQDYTAERQDAYLDQYRCLYGKLQQFMNKMQENGLLKNSKIVLMGASSVNNFQNIQYDDYIEKFLNNNLINLAIYNDRNTQYQYDTSICPAINLITQQLFGFGECREIENLHEQTLLNLKQTLRNLEVKQNNNGNIDFDKWYDQWKKYNE